MSNDQIPMTNDVHLPLLVKRCLVTGAFLHWFVIRHFEYTIFC
jgi:hypothetical protein